MKPNWFIAFPVEGSWLNQVVDDLPEMCRAFKPGDLHITIAFLGAIDRDVALGLIPQMEQLNAKPFEVSLGNIMPLPSLKRCSALTLGLKDGHNQAATLMGQWRDGLIAAADQPPDLRTPLPHITVARPIRNFKAPAREAGLAWAKHKTIPEIRLTLDRVALYTWADDRQKAQFKIVHEHRWH